jgi:hypothetical protein
MRQKHEGKAGKELAEQKSNRRHGAGQASLVFAGFFAGTSSSAFFIARA